MEQILERIETNMQTKQEATNQLNEIKTTVNRLTEEFNSKLAKYHEETDKNT